MTAFVKLVSLLMAVVVCIAACEGGAITKRRAPSLYDADIEDKVYIYIFFIPLSLTNMY